MARLTLVICGEARKIKPRSLQSEDRALTSRLFLLKNSPYLYLSLPLLVVNYILFPFEWQDLGSEITENAILSKEMYPTLFKVSHSIILFVSWISVPYLTLGLLEMERSFQNQTFSALQAGMLNLLEQSSESTLSPKNIF